MDTEELRCFGMEQQLEKSARITQNLSAGIERIVASANDVVLARLL